MGYALIALGERSYRGKLVGARGLPRFIGYSAGDRACDMPSSRSESAPTGGNL